MFCSNFHPWVGGAERQAEKLSRALIEQGCEVAVLTPRHDPAWPLRETREGLPVLRYPLPDLTRLRPGSRGLGVPNLWLHRRATARAVAEHLPGYDLLHTHLASSLVSFAAEAAHRLGRPVLCKVAGGGPSFDFIHLRRSSVLGARIGRQLVQSIDRWIAISSEIRGFLEAEGVPAARIASIPNGVAVPDAAPPPVERVRRFLFLGKAIKCDWRTLFAAFDRLLERAPDCRLEFTMGPRGGDAVRSARDALPRARHAIELVEQVDPREAFARADALVQPTPAEGMSNTVLEAMAAGLPIVASDIPSNREVLDGGGCGLLVPLEDPEALAGALLDVVEHPEPASTRARAAWQKARDVYALPRVAERVRALYGEVLAEWGGAGAPASSGRSASA